MFPTNANCYEYIVPCYYVYSTILYIFFYWNINVKMNLTLRTVISKRNIKFTRTQFGGTLQNLLKYSFSHSIFGGGELNLQDNEVNRCEKTSLPFFYRKLLLLLQSSRCVVHILDFWAKKRTVRKIFYFSSCIWINRDNLLCDIS